MSRVKPNIDPSRFKLSEEQKAGVGGIDKNRQFAPLQQVQNEFDRLEQLDLADARHSASLKELFPEYILNESNTADWQLFRAMSRFDHRNDTFVVGCFRCPPGFKLISYKWRIKDGVKWRTRSGTSPNSTPFVRIFTDDEPIYIIEGHRDSLTAILLGLDFIMLPYAGFHSKEPESLQKEVENREVVLLVEDQAAYECMFPLAKILSETASCISLVQLVEGDGKVDLSDFVQKFNTIKEVRDALQNKR